jgi:hypothetical protein
VGGRKQSLLLSITAAGQLQVPPPSSALLLAWAKPLQICPAMACPLHPHRRAASGPGLHLGPVLFQFPASFKTTSVKDKHAVSNIDKLRSLGEASVVLRAA